MDPKIYSNGSIEIYAQDKYSADKRWESFKLYLNKSLEEAKLVKTLGVIYYYMKILKRRQLFEKISIILVIIKN